MYIKVYNKKLIKKRTNRNYQKNKQMQKYYRIQFTSKLEKMSLAFKMECDIQIFWKRGQKIAQSGKVPFKNCTAYFNKQLTISCNMVFDTQKKLFKEKQTKFAIVIYTQKGNKQAGQILFDVAPFLNQRNKSKTYQLNLTKCPDKNAKLTFSLKANIIEQQSPDNISQGSFVSVDIQNLTGAKTSQMSTLRPTDSNIVHQPQNIINLDNKSSTSIMSKNKQRSAQMVPTTDRLNQKPSNPNPKTQNGYNTQRNQNTAQIIKSLQQQNKKIRQQLKRKQQLRKQNEQLKKRLKQDDYQSCKQYKKKIDLGKKEIQNLVNQSKGAKKLNQDIKKLEKDILKSKQHIMRVFNQTSKIGLDQIDRIQLECGIKQY